MKREDLGFGPWPERRFGHDGPVSDERAVPPWVAAHAAANAAEETHYRDPDTGYRVFTEYGLRARGTCCGCGCRHCPWAHEAVPASLRAVRIVRPAWLTGRAEPGQPTNVVFWSGGKDSFLAARAFLRHRPNASLVLLTTFGQKTRIVAHQELPIQSIIAQAQALERPLFGVPLYPGADYTRAIRDALSQLGAEAPIESLVFGDLHLEHVRRWRETELGPIAAHIGATLEFPLWGADYQGLQDDLQASGVQARVCATPDPATIAPVRIGDRFGPELVARLPSGVDAFGECGEFHTEVVSDGLRPAHLE